ncbi:hypothetical protein, partial [Undibacterium sp.]|uniref:hypothetical protein n=1 Tax=Undibacterium sp. TaxID=1914977 RepID=UPI002B90277B
KCLHKWLRLYSLLQRNLPSYKKRERPGFTGTRPLLEVILEYPRQTRGYSAKYKNARQGNTQHRRAFELN